MTRRNQIFLIIFLFLLLLVLIYFAFGRTLAPKLIRNKEITVPATEELPELSSPLRAVSLEEDNLKYSSKQNGPGADGHLVFFAPEGTKLYPIFSGTVERVGVYPEMSDIIVKKDDQELRASYLVWGEVLAEVNQKVNQETEIAILGEPGKGPGVMGGANLGIWVYDEAGDSVDLGSLKEKILK